MVMALTAGQVSDHTGAKIVYPALPEADILIADMGYDSEEWRHALKAKGILSCNPPFPLARLLLTSIKMSTNNVI